MAPAEAPSSPTPSASPPPSLARDLRAAARLATDATLGVTTLVEAVHARTGLPKTREHTRGITGFVYRTVRGVTAQVGGGVDALLAVAAPLLPAPTAAVSPRREAVVSALNGVCGDHLARTGNPLAIEMRVRHAGRALPLVRDALAQALPEAGGRLLVLVHGLCMNDLQWRHGVLDGHPDHGERLARALGYTPVYLHYNTGLPVPDNGRALAALLEQLVDAWPRPLERVAIVAHSMGGLVARSALHHARAAGLHWPGAVDDVVFLGTPHHGAPLERAGHGIERLLDATPWAAPFARLARVRSDGITDLRHGNLLDADRVATTSGAHAARDRRTPVPLPDGPRCHAVAGTTGDDQGDLADRVLGDGLVPLASALGRHRLARRTLQFAPDRQRTFAQTNHMQLLSSPAVGEQLVAWLGA